MGMRMSTFIQAIFIQAITPGDPIKSPGAILVPGCRCTTNEGKGGSFAQL